MSFLCAFSLMMWRGRSERSFLQASAPTQTTLSLSWKRRLTSSHLAASCTLIKFTMWKREQILLTWYTRYCQMLLHKTFWGWWLALVCMLPLKQINPVVVIVYCTSLLSLHNYMYSFSITYWLSFVVDVQLLLNQMFYFPVNSLLCVYIYQCLWVLVHSFL